MAVRVSEEHKNSYAKEVVEARGVAFVPLAADTFGGFGDSASDAISKVAAHARLCRGEDFELTRTRLVQRLQVAVMRGVARQLLRRITHPGNDNETDEDDGADDEE